MHFRFLTPVTCVLFSANIRFRLQFGHDRSIPSHCDKRLEFYKIRTHQGRRMVEYLGWMPSMLDGIELGLQSAKCNRCAGTKLEPKDQFCK